MPYPAPTPGAPYPAAPYPGPAAPYPGAPQGGAPLWGQPYPGYGAPGMYPAPPAPAPKKRTRKRILVISSSIVAAVALVTVGVVALLPGRTGNSVVAAVKCQPIDLAGCLIKPPAGALRLSGTTTWPQTTMVSTDQYSSNITKDAKGVGTDTATQLTVDGARRVVHVDWNAVDGNNVDIVLISFESQKGAQAWNSARAAEIMAAYPGAALAIPGDASGKAHAATKADQKGNIDAAYSTVAGNIVLDVAYSSPKQLSADDLKNWAGTELASVRSAPPVAADPADAAPGSEQIACAASLNSCLEPMPSGAEHWSSPTDKQWVKSSSLSVDQYVRLRYEDSAQTRVTTDFNAQGVTAIAHQDWDIDNANKQADIYLIRTITAAGAATLSSNNIGEPNWGSGISGVTYAIPNEPDTQAWYANKKDSDGFTTFFFTTVKGNVAVDGWLFFYGSFDSATADKWAQGQVDRLSQSLSTQPMGLFPLTPPTLPAPSQASCPAADDCLMPLPSGTTDTTQTSFATGKILDAATYATQYDGATSTEVATWLGADGLNGAEHRAWSAGSGAAVDTDLLKFDKPAQAQAAAMLEYGFNAVGDRVCTDSAVPDSLCLATAVSTNDPLQKETIRVLAWKGDYEVSVSVTVSNSADVADAFAWAQQQLNLLPAT
ncbi:MAG TPA: hypothetical protein VFU73_01595 [Actinocrinis sp.]|nr:hypothetical protein [Actinocrinis sp.]